MKICIDCRMISASGIGVYLRECLPFFLKTDNNFLLLGKSDTLFSISSNNENAEILECSIKVFSIGELIFFPQKTISRINKCDLFYSPFFNVPRGLKIPVYTTIHDIIFPDMPELSSKFGLALRKYFYTRACKRSKKIFTVSNFSKNRIEYHLGTSRPIIVTHSAIQPKFLNFKNHMQSSRKRETIIFIGNIKKHKGLKYLLEAFTLAKNEGLPHKLVIIGAKDNFRSSDREIFRMIDSLDNEAVTFTGFISDEELMEHLSAAALLVQPSLYEGFCLPPLEAMVLGTRALVSDIPVLREIYHEYPVVFFKPGDSIDLKNKIMEILLKKDHPFPKLSGELMTKYTFEKTARTIIKELQ